MQNIIIRENIEQHMSELRCWLDENYDTKPEDMRGFFAARLAGYEQHMLSNWGDAYTRLAELIPADTHTLLDLGCGTGLEIDAITARLATVKITGIDLSDDMLRTLRQKHPTVNAILADYFVYDFGTQRYDAAVSFESLHHFNPVKKGGLYRKVMQSLKPGGVFILADYVACCDEEESLLMAECDRKRRAAAIPDDQFIHFDTPLTAEREVELLLGAGFVSAELIDCVKGVAFIAAQV